MKKAKKPAKKDIPAPEVYSFSRGEVEMTPEVKKWLDAEVRAQSRRYESIYSEIEEIAPEREKWLKEFFERITTVPGFSVDGGIRRVIKKSELPKKPRRKWRVVW